jgi:uncharacterized damage-inducible protein DinB
MATLGRIPWLERHFETGLPLEMFPNLLERLRGTPARVEDRLHGAPLEALTASNGESWSILENVGHLLQVEGLWAARLDDFEAGRAELTPARFESWRVGEAQFNRRAAKDLCHGFRIARRVLVERLERLDDETMRVVARHPRLDRPMRIVDLMLFIAEHDDHHLVTITQLLHARGSHNAQVPRGSVAGTRTETGT